MLRIVSGAFRGAVSRATSLTSAIVTRQANVEGKFARDRCFGVLSSCIQNNLNCGVPRQTLLDRVLAKSIGPSPVVCTPVRTVTKVSRRKGKRKCVKTVIKRFYRLNWGIWIRPYSGCYRAQWKKRPSRRVRHRKLVFTNSTQSYLLDKMVTSWWRRPRYHVEDPFNPYHKREEFFITRKAPLP